GYYLENSGTQFNWQRAGVIGPVKLTADESTTLLAQTSDDNGDKVNETGLDSRAGFNYLLNIIEARTGYDFAQWDTNKDGSISEGLRLMSCTIFAGNDDRRTVHLDPWHKMQLGWLRPRIFTLAAGGVATIAGSQILSPDTPLILYDPAKGTSEYFMVEFRSN